MAKRNKSIDKATEALQTAAIRCISSITEVVEISNTLKLSKAEIRAIKDDLADEIRIKVIEKSVILSPEEMALWDEFYAHVGKKFSMDWVHNYGRVNITRISKK